MAQAEMNGSEAGEAGMMKGKRTRGPRSCLECRSSKQRCEQMNFAAIVPSNEPQPLHMACRRCRVLQLACIVPDQLPKSTRLRIERTQNINPRQHPAQPPEIGHRTYSDPSQNPNAHHRASMPVEAAWHANAQQTPPQYQQHLNRFEDGSQYEMERGQYPVHHSVAGYPQSHGGGPLPSPGASSSAHAQSQSSRSPSSRPPPLFGAGTSTRFEPTVFDPMPILRDTHSMHHLNTSPSSHLLPSLPSGALPPPPSNGSDPRQTHARAAFNAAPAESPHSQSSGGADAAGEPTWYYRARIACRPAQLVEHLLSNDPLGDRDLTAPNTPSLTGLPRLEDIVQLLLNNAGFMPHVERRMTNMQRALPFMPSLRVCMEDVHRSAFLLGAIMHLEGRMPANEASLLQKHLSARCSHYTLHPPETMYDVAACLLVASFSPLLLRTSSLVGVVAGNALLQSATHAAVLLKLDAAPAQLASYLDNAESTHQELPSLDSALVLNAFLWLYLVMQELILELIDDPMPRRVQPPHPRYGASRTSDPASVEALTSAVDRYCRAVIEQHAEAAAAAAVSPLQPLSASSPTHGLHRCASMVLCAFATRVSSTVCQNVRSFSAQFEDQVRRQADSSSRVLALRRWCDQAIENLGVTMSAARESLRDTATFLGERHVASSAQLKYFELSIAAIEFAALSQLKDKLYVAGHGFLGATRTSQEFLFGIFARPQLLKSYENLGIVRACVAKQVLMLLANMVMDLQPVRRNRGGGSGGDLPSRFVKDDSPLAHWGGLAHTFPLARWCGLMVACVTVLVEELAGRFLAQEAPLGAQGESRLETYTMVIRKTYENLVPFEEDARMRYHGFQSEQTFDQMPQSDQGWPISVTLDALEKALNALITWRKKASGVGEYDRPSPNRLTQSALDAAAASVMKSHPSHMSAMTGAAPSMATHAVPLHASMPAPPMQPTGSNDHRHTRAQPRQGTGSAGVGQAPPLEQIHFGDALLHDILFTPIEHFFGAEGTLSAT